MNERATDDLLEKVSGLTREEVLEAALAVGEQLGTKEVSGEESEGFLAEAEGQPYAVLEEVEQLARTALIAAALDPASREAVQEVVDRVGQKAFIFGGAEIVAAGIVALALLQAIQSKGRTSEEETLEVGHDDRGRPYVKHRRKITYGVSPRLGQLLSSIFRSTGGT